jgi:hypothetical protein
MDGATKSSSSYAAPVQRQEEEPEPEPDPENTPDSDPDPDSDPNPGQRPRYTDESPEEYDEQRSEWEQRQQQKAARDRSLGQDTAVWGGGKYFLHGEEIAPCPVEPGDRIPVDQASAPTETDSTPDGQNMTPVEPESTPEDPNMTSVEDESTPDDVQDEIQRNLDRFDRLQKNGDYLGSDPAKLRDRLSSPDQATRSAAEDELNSFEKAAVGQSGEAPVNPESSPFTLTAAFNAVMDRYLEPLNQEPWNRHPREDFKPVSLEPEDSDNPNEIRQVLKIRGLIGDIQGKELRFSVAWDQNNGTFEDIHRASR